MPETTPLIKAALNLRVGAGFDVYAVIHRGQKYQRNYGSISAETSRVYRTGNQKF